ncbi:hypothetical protein YALI2_A00178g [Yarrowia lipolytica]|nr:hypothetical protein YALI2_A00178g [Yarrowia lipolytica]
METITKGYPQRIVEETENLVTRYHASRDQSSPQSALKLWKETPNEPLGRFARSGERNVERDERLESDLAFVAGLVVALKIHSQFEGITAILARLSKPASHSAVVVAEKHLLEAIGYDLVGSSEIVLT